MIRRLWIAFVSLMLAGVPLIAHAQPSQGSATDGFVQLSSLPPGEQMPAAPLSMIFWAMCVGTSS